MTVLCAVLAGGRSRRFGSDKAVAMLGDMRLIDRVFAALRPQVDAVILVGRDGGISDRPMAGLGPLAGLNAALHHAQGAGHGWVVSVPCDAPQLPGDMVERLRGPAARFVIASPVIGWWPAALAGRLDDHLASTDDRSMRGWARAIGAQAIDVGPIANVNTRDDLARVVSGQSS